MEQKKDSPKEASSETTVEEEIHTDDMQINDSDDVVSDEEWSQRKMCSDGACIGVIGPDGRCKECGRPYDGDASDTDPEDEPDAWAEDEDTSLKMKTKRIKNRQPNRIRSGRSVSCAATVPVLA